MSAIQTTNGHLDLVADELWERRSELVIAQIEALEAFDQYAAVPHDELMVSCERNVVRFVSLLRGEAPLPAEIVEDERRSGARRAHQGIPAEVVLEAYRAVIGIIRDAFLEIAASRHAPVEAMLDGVRRMWLVMDQFSSDLVSARHEVALNAARIAEQHRIGFIRHVLDGDPTPEEVMEEGAKFGVVADGTYWVVLAHCGNEDPEVVRRALSKTGLRGELADLVAATSEGCGGITAVRPSLPIELRSTVAVAGPVGISDLRKAADECRRVLDAARRFDVEGIVDRDRLGLRLAVAENRDLGDLLRARHLDPVLKASSMGQDILKTIEAYLELRSVPDAARQLSVHVNTVRYRIDKYTEITGTDLGRTVEAFEVWWALQLLRLTA